MTAAVVVVVLLLTSTASFFFFFFVVVVTSSLPSFSSPFVDGASAAVAAIIMPPSSPKSSSSLAAAGASDRLVYGSNDALFGCIEKKQGSKPFGRFLDAGTGTHSLRWIATLAAEKYGMTEFVAVTADLQMQRNVQKEAEELGVSQYGRVVVGNWFPEEGGDCDDLASELLRCGDGGGGGGGGEDGQEQQQQPGCFDTILADYLIGAMDGFSPYRQDRIFEKLASLLAPGGRLYVVGLQPIPDSCPGDDANVVCKVRQARDACILLAGHRCYREYPIDWVRRQIRDNEDRHSLRLLSSSRFPILYRFETIKKQINVGRSKLPLFPNPALATGMAELLDDLEERAREATARSTTGRLQLGFDYVVAAEKLHRRQQQQRNDDDDDAAAVAAGREDE